MKHIDTARNTADAINTANEIVAELVERGAYEVTPVFTIHEVTTDSHVNSYTGKTMHRWNCSCGDSGAMFIYATAEEAQEVGERNAKHAHPLFWQDRTV